MGTSSLASTTPINFSIDTATLIVIILAIIGWIVALILQRKNITDQTRAQINYDVYGELVSVHQEMQDALAGLNTASYPPFILMEAMTISSQNNLSKKHEDLRRGWEKWNDHIQKSFDNYFEFSDSYTKFLSLAENWEGVLKNLSKAKEILHDETEKSEKQIRTTLSYLQSISTKYPYDYTTWKKEDKDKIEKEAEKISEGTNDIGCYLSDFMVCVYNEIMADYFKHKRKTRKPTDPKYKVLTKDGLKSIDELKNIY